MNKTPLSEYKIRFNDCDMFGHLNNARYLDYMINARQDHLRDTYNFDYNSYYKNSQGWVINFHEIQYIKPAVFEETVCIQSSLLGLDIHTLHVEVAMFDQKVSHLKALLRSRLTFVNLKTGRKIQHSPEFMSWANDLVAPNVHGDEPINERIKQLLLELKNKNGISHN